MSTTETFKARAFDHLGHMIGEWEAETVPSAMAKAERDLGDSRVYVRVNGEFTSDGTKHANHGGRLWASRYDWRAHDTFGPGGWVRE